MCPDEPGTSSPSLQAFVADLVHKLDPDARLADFAVADERYTLRIDLPGEMGKSFAVPQRVVEKAATDQRALTILRSTLRSVVLTIRSQRALQESRDALSGTGTEPICPVCSQRIRLGEPVAFEHGAMFHVRCRR